MLSESPSWSPANPEPPADLLSDFVGAYREKLYFQPLPLFDPRRLQLKIGTLPHYLRWSFLALTLHFTSHNFYYGLEANAIEYYTTSARSIVVDMAAEGLAQLEVLQTLCLLALCDHIAGKTSRAWMMVGMAAKLEALRLSQSKADLNTRHSDDTISRCHWSIAILESTFIPNCNTLTGITGAPSYPKSVPRPTPLHSSHGMKSYCPDLTDAYEGNIQDVGINATCLGYISVWGSIISYLRDIRNGANEYPWLATSRHNQLTVKLYELENITSHRHLIRNAPFPDQPSEDLSEHREYWAPWVSFQIMMHATQAILNNPFVQLVALRRAGRNFQPRSFLQNTVDQALFHAEWVSRLVQMCADRQFEVNDPLIGQAVAGCVSILWIFQFARDRKVSEKAKENLVTCETFLGHLARKWPHIAEKLEILRTLNVKVAKQQQTPQEDELTSATIKFEPDMMWELLDPAISGVDWASLCSSSKGKGSHATTSATIRVATKFVHPINNEVESAPIPSPSSETENQFRIRIKPVTNMRAEQTILAFNSLFGAATTPFGCGEVNVFYTGLPGRHQYVTSQGYDAKLVEEQIFNHTRELREAGYNVRAVWRGPEMPPNEFVDQMKDVHWHAAGIGFGVRGSQILDVIGLFEETIDIFRKEAPDAKYVFNYNPLTFLWSVKRYFPLSIDCKDQPGKDLGYVTLCDEACK
ncbi:hypothetical protein FCULG_00007723 [Fusarium culmorum]|uniref:Transcription factor domain-containing protein n=1 Tax=Fusarium culmorum TaxID=5516 RepID=A0A2T4H4L4_FUSCU|nr:hypothetical protein FCULG_00007723 [Fusarium culmorum]